MGVSTHRGVPAPRLSNHGRNQRSNPTRTPLSFPVVANKSSACLERADGIGRRGEWAREENGLGCAARQHDGCASGYRAECDDGGQRVCRKLLRFASATKRLERKPKEREVEEGSGNLRRCPHVSSTNTKPCAEAASHSSAGRFASSCIPPKKPKSWTFPRG